MFWEKRLVGIDIGSSSIKMMDTANFGSSILAMDCEYLPYGSFENGLVKEPNAVVETIQTLAHRMGIKPSSRRVCLGLNTNFTMIKSVRTDPQSEKLPGDVAYEEVQAKFSQDEISDIYFDFTETSYTKEGSPASIVVVAAKRDFVDQGMMLVKAAGFKIGAVDCDALALRNIVLNVLGSPKAPMILLDFGASTLQIVWIYPGPEILSRVLPFGGNIFTEALQQTKGIELEEAEKQKTNPFKSKADFMEQATIFRNQSEYVASEISSTLAFFLNQAEELGLRIPAPRGILLTGGASKTPGLVQILKVKLKMNVSIFQPFRKIQPPMNLYRFAQNNGHLLSTALGLSMRQWDDIGETLF